MAFDPTEFEAKVALKLLLTEELPAAAQDALEAGYDGRHLLRMAVLDRADGWLIEQELPSVLQELGLAAIPVGEAALRLGRLRAREILTRGEDPLAAVPYFYRLLLAGDYPDELQEIAYIDEYIDLQDEVTLREDAREALKELLSPELQERRRAERRAQSEASIARLTSEWPYVFASPSGRTLFKKRFVDRLREGRPVAWMLPLSWLVGAWGFGWRVALFLAVTSTPVLLVLGLWTLYLEMRRDRRATLLRLGVPKDQI